MVINTFHIIAIIGLVAIILETFMVSMKKSIRRLYTYPLLTIRINEKHGNK